MGNTTSLVDGRFLPQLVYRKVAFWNKNLDNVYRVFNTDSIFTDYSTFISMSTKIKPYTTKTKQE